MTKKPALHECRVLRILNLALWKETLAASPERAKGVSLPQLVR